ncbi:MAG: hypothetical protein KHX55_04100 [Proteobacteria bacterium]|nr:hypothetical protein [Pseudomonadota bacterium]
MEIIKPINREDWVDADPANGIVGAIPPAKAFSQTMEEMVNVILASGQEPSGEDLHQFEKGIKQLVQLKVDEANLLAVSNTVYQRNVGDFFYTHNKLRGTAATGSLNGGFECNGDEFAEADFTGDANPYTLLVNNQLPWVSYENYAQIVARFGNCGYFGLDKTNKKFKVPTITSAFLQSGTPGVFKEAGLPNITGEFASGANVSWADTRTEWKGAFRLGRARGGSGERRGMTQYFGNFDASWSNVIYGKSSTVQPPAVSARIMVQLANEIDNATSVEKYLAQIKDAQKSALTSIQAAISNLSATAEQALTDIDTSKTNALTALDAAKTSALAALQALYDSSIADIQIEIADLQKYVDKTVEPLYDAFDAAVEKSDENIVTLTEQNTTAEQNIAKLTQLNEGATALAYTVHENATTAETAAAAATAAQTAAETAVNGFAENAAFCMEAAQAAIETAKDNAVATVNASADEIKATVEQAATTAENAQNTANSVVTQLEGFTETVNTAKTEITTLATTEKTGISTAATNAQTAATTVIDTAKTNAVAAVEEAAANAGVPAGGATGEVLRKSSDADRATEWADIDTVFVHKTGDETVAGTKKFQNIQVFEASESRKVSFKSKDMDLDNPSEKTNQIWFDDKNGFAYAVVQANQTASGLISLLLSARNKTSGFKSMGLSVLPDGTVTTTVPTPAAEVTGTQIVNAEWVRKYQHLLSSITNTSGTIALEINKIYTMTVSAATTFTLPTPSNTNMFNQIKIMMKVTGTPTINWGTTNFFNKTTPEIAAGSYDVYFDYDKLMNAWVCGVMPKGAAS